MVVGLPTDPVRRGVLPSLCPCRRKRGSVVGVDFPRWSDRTLLRTRSVPKGFGSIVMSRRPRDRKPPSLRPPSLDCDARMCPHTTPPLPPFHPRGERFSGGPRVDVDLGSHSQTYCVAEVSAEDPPTQPPQEGVGGGAWGLCVCPCARVCVCVACVSTCVSFTSSRFLGVHDEIYRLLTWHGNTRVTP